MSEEAFTEGVNNLAKKNDGTLALIILAVAVVVVIVVGLYMLKNKMFSSGADISWKQSTFTPPIEREEFIAAKEKLDPSKVSDLDELKKLLMRRAIQTIPLLLSLQNEGSSIDRLYKRGMLTDDMHFKVKELKAFVDKEFQDVQFEADDLMEGWGQHIWPQAMQFHQMIQKQAEAKAEEQRAVEEEKKKSKKAKKQVSAEEDAPSSASTAPSSSASASTSASAAAPSSSSSAATTSAAAGAGTSATGTSPVAKKAVRVPRVIRPVDPDEIKIQDAERMAQQLLEEEEREQKKASSAKKGGKK